MITVGRLIELLSRVPPDATVYAYEGEDTGLQIARTTPDPHENKVWWIRATPEDAVDEYIEGFV